MVGVEDFLNSELGRRARLKILDLVDLLDHQVRLVQHHLHIRHFGVSIWDSGYIDGSYLRSIEFVSLNSRLESDKEQKEHSGYRI